MSRQPAASIPALVWCPFPDSDTAAKIADTLLEERLIACANIMPGMISRYVWNGARGVSEEAGALFKTNAAALEALTIRLAELHPYEAPAILGWHCDASRSATAAWLEGMGR